MDRFDINSQLEAIGFGKFQIMAIFVMGYRLFCYGSTNSLLAILEPYLRKNWHLSYWTSTWLVLPEVLSSIPGSILLGRLADIYGRRKILILVLILNSYFSALYSFSTNLYLMGIIRGFIGLVSSSNVIAYTYLLEILPLSQRKYSSLLHVTFFAGTAYGIFAGRISIEHLTWRWFVILSEAIPLAVGACLMFLVPESPRYLLVSGRTDDAEDSLQRIARINGLEKGYISLLGSSSGGQFSVEQKNDEEDLSPLEIAKRIILVSYIQFLGFLYAAMMRFGAMQFGENSDLNKETSCSVHFTYKYIWALEISVLLAVFTSYLLLGKFTRRQSFYFLITYLSLCILPLYWDIRGWLLTIFMTLSGLGFAAFNTIVYVYGAELIPTSTRSFGCGISEAAGQAGACLGQFIALYVHQVSIHLSFGILHGFSVIGILLMLTFFKETKEKHLK
ncbi:synaptic vesicle 2-related protein-like [Rhopilema esculentum]|uniref:synaptic vesicle 2-related protein-like n=1 Tax=Rhopilema esculentum TaxID=499914 RepID=UPI0031CF3AD2|eukprot:gene6364-11800_t